MAKNVRKTKHDTIHSFVAIIQNVCPGIEKEYNLDALAEDFLNRENFVIGKYTLKPTEKPSIFARILKFLFFTR